MRILNEWITETNRSSKVRIALKSVNQSRISF